MKRTLITIALTATLTSGAIAFITTTNASAPPPTVANSQNSQPFAATVDHAAIIDALTETPQLIGLTGDIAKTITYTDDKWYGDKTYELTLNGEFKLGVDTEDIDITTRGNTVIVKFPQPKLITVDLPFDAAEITKDVGWLREGLDENELQALYAEARTGAVEEIKVNCKAREQAEESIEDAIEGIIEQVPSVEDVVFAN